MGSHSLWHPRRDAPVVDWAGGMSPGAYQPWSTIVALKLAPLIRLAPAVAEPPAGLYIDSGCLDRRPAVGYRAQDPVGRIRYRRRSGGKRHRRLSPSATNGMSRPFSQRILPKRLTGVRGGVRYPRLLTNEMAPRSHTPTQTPQPRQMSLFTSA